MKNYALFFILLSLFSIKSCKPVTREIDIDGLNGKVKFLNEISYEGDKDPAKDSLVPEFSSIQTRYDKNGFILEQSYFDQGKLILKKIPLRKNNRLIGHEQFSGEGFLMLKSTIRKISESEFEEVNIDFRGKLNSTERLTYKDNRLTSKTLIYQTLEFITIYNYDSNGMMLSSRQSNNSGEEPYNYNYEYLDFDKYRNWTKRKDYDPGGSKEIKYTTIRKYQYY